MAKIGRPTDFTEELGDEICAQVMQGYSLVKILKAENMPEPSTIYRWFRLHSKFRENYATAKQDQADYFVEDILEISDAATSDTIQVDRLRVDTRKWAASKYKPKKYGDSTTLKGDAENPLEIISREQDATALEHLKMKLLTQAAHPVQTIKE